MNIDRINDIESFIIPEKYLLRERQLVNTKWVEPVDANKNIMEVEIVLNYDKIKDNMISCKFYNRSRRVITSLLSILFLAENSKLCKYKIIDGKLKINMFYGLSMVVLTHFYTYTPIQIHYDEGTIRHDSIRIKEWFHVDNEYDTACGMNCSSEFMYKTVDVRIDKYDNDAASWRILGLFIWIDDQNAIENELPIVKIDDQVYIESHKIKRIKVLHYNGFFVQLSSLTLKQIFNLDKYDRCLENYIYKKASEKRYPITFENYRNALIEYIYL